MVVQTARHDQDSTVFMRAGAILSKSLLGKEEPSSWHQAAALLPAFKAPEGPVDPDLFERLRQR